MSQAGHSVPVTDGLIILMGVMALGKLISAFKPQIPFFFFRYHIKEWGYHTH